MPRDLTDLMEAAVSAAPPETHHAADITRLAERRQRRRTTFVAAGAALAVIAVAGGAFGLNRGHDSTPEPVGPTVRMDQHQKLSEAVPLREASDFRELTYDAPSMLPPTGSFAAVPLYQDVDAQGRLLTERIDSSPVQVHYLRADGPGTTPHEVPAPSTSTSQDPGSSLGGNTWSYTFTGDGRLLWLKGGGGVGVDARVTSLDGSGTLPVQVSLDGIRYHGRFGIARARNVWVDVDRAWFDVTTRSNDSLKHPVELVSLYSSDLAAPASPRAEQPKDALEISVSHGEAVWVDATGQKVFAEDLASGATHEVPIPLGRGCRMPKPASYLGENQHNVQTSGSLVAVNEVCGPESRVVVSDLSGRLVTEIDPGAEDSVIAVGLGQRTVTFAGVTPFAWYTDDLVTGELVRLGDVGSGGIETQSRSAGSYVLWYDKDGGHVGKFAG